MKKYIYKRLYWYQAGECYKFNDGDNLLELPADLIDALNELGERGWQLISNAIDCNHFKESYVLMKEIQDS